MLSGLRQFSLSSLMYSRMVAVVSGRGRWVSICDLTSASSWYLGASWCDVDVSGICRQRKLVTSAVFEVSECPSAVDAPKFKNRRNFQFVPFANIFSQFYGTPSFESTLEEQKKCDGPRTAATSPLHSSNNRPQQVRKILGLLSCTIYWNQPCGYIRSS